MSTQQPDNGLLSRIRSWVSQDETRNETDSVTATVDEVDATTVEQAARENEIGDRRPPITICHICQRPINPDREENKVRCGGDRVHEHCVAGWH